MELLLRKQIKLLNCPVFLERFNRFLKEGGKIRFSSNLKPLGAYYYMDKVILINNNNSMGDILVVLYHELSHYEYWNKAVDLVFEEIRCHSEMFMFYQEYIKHKYECPKTEERMYLVSGLGVGEYVDWRYVRTAGGIK